MNIRVVTQKDTEALITADSLSFAAFRQKHGNPAVCRRTPQNIHFLASRAPKGCYVAESDGIKGYVFNRVWGSVGWIGPLGVVPDKQSSGIGKLLLQKSCEYLENCGCSVIGLETMPDTPYNIGMYMKYGFFPCEGSAVFKKVFTKNQKIPDTMTILSEEYSVSEAAQISETLYCGLDYSGEITAVSHTDFRKCLHFKGNRYSGFTILDIKSKLQNDDSRALQIYLLFSGTKNQAHLAEIFNALERFAVENNYESLVFPVNLINQNAAQVLLKLGYQVSYYGVRMLLKGNYRVNGTDLVRWIG